jgi:WD40 repeat protein
MPPSTLPANSSIKQITTQLSTREVTLNASQPVAGFEVIVYNDSDRFASFQVQLSAAGLSAATGSTSTAGRWYRLTPAVSSKIPAGDCTRFQVEVFDVPPINADFHGAVDLTLEVTSRELSNQSDRQTLRLVVQGLQTQPPRLSFTPPVAVHPGESVVLAGRIANQSPGAMEIVVALQGLPPGWFPKGIKQKIVLPAQQTTPVLFDCDIPEASQTRNQTYPLSLEATGRFPQVTATGQLQILPAGEIRLVCERTEASIPERLDNWQNPAQGRTEFRLQLENHSNLEPQIAIALQQVKPQRRRFWHRLFPPAILNPPEHPDPNPDAPENLAPSEFSEMPKILASSEDRDAFEAPDSVGIAARARGTVAPGISQPATPVEGLVIDEEVCPIGMREISLPFERSLPWWGWQRVETWQVSATPLHCDFPITDRQQLLKLRIFPRIPFWLQVLGLLLALGGGALAGMQLRGGHRGPVNSVQFSGQGVEVLSGSADQTFRRWRSQPGILNSSLQAQHRSPNLNRAVRVVRYRPVNNDQVAIGFENGEMQVVNVVTGALSDLRTDKDDRIFDLVFSRDGQTLLSGHGSGAIFRWDITRPSSPRGEKLYEAGFAIEGMALVGEGSQTLAIGGRQNRLILVTTNPAELAATASPRRSDDRLKNAEQKPVAAGLKAAKAAKAAKATETEAATETEEADDVDSSQSDGPSDSAAEDTDAAQPQVAAKNPKAITRPDPPQPRPAARSLVTEIRYPFAGNAQEFISSLAAAEQQPQLLAVSDTQGRLSLWDTALCLQRSGSCSPLEQPWLGHGGSPIRAIALTANACFMASAADDGQVKLWALDGQGGKREPEGRVLVKARRPLKAVDIIQTRDAVWVTSGGDDGQVRLSRVKLSSAQQSTGDRCPVLKGGPS